MAIISSLKHIQQYMKQIKKIPENGLAMFANNEKVVVITPPLPIVQFVYKCDKKYHVEELFDLYQTHDQYGVVLVSGHCCFFYTMTAIHHQLLYKINVSLQSRQKKGGQSAVRIARIAEEKRHIYLKQIVEKLNDCFLTTPVKAIVVAGPSEMKNLVCECELLDYRLKILMTHKLTMDIDQGSIHKIMDMDLFKVQQLDDEELMCKTLIESEHTIYGLEEIEKYINYKNCNLLYIHETMDYQSNNECDIKIIKTTQYYGKMFIEYGGIMLMPYYIMDEQI